MFQSLPQARPCAKSALVKKRVLHRQNLVRITMEVLPKIVYSVFVNDLDSEKTSFIDLFCGCGGFTKGFSEAGFSSVFGIDVWKDATVTYKHNFPNSVAFCGDIKELSSGKIFELTKLKKNDIPLIIGGPPC